jgi:predicted RNase H-like HicB family nuclease
VNDLMLTLNRQVEPPQQSINNKFNNKHYPSISMKSMEKLNVTAIIWQEDDVYVSKCPELEVASAGDTPEEALENLKEAVELYLENAKALGILNDFDASLHSPNKFTSTIGVAV